jgi:outer membrane protein assembly factor BamB
MTEVLAAGGQAAAAFVLGPGSLYTAHFGENPASQATVREFDLRDGSLRWAVGVPQNVQNLVLDAGAHVLMGRSGLEPKIVFLDADTGDNLWHVEEPNTSAISLARGAVLMRTDLSATESSLRLLDSRTGRPIWTRTVSAMAAIDLPPPAPNRIVTVSLDGTLTALNGVDGSVLSQGSLDVQMHNGGSVSVVGDDVFVAGSGSLTAYSVVPFARRWESATAGDVTDCGPVICVDDERGLIGVDRATGTTRWLAAGWHAGVLFDPAHLYATDSQDQPAAALLDAATGRVTRRLGHTLQIGPLLVRADGRVHDRNWVTETDPADGVAHVVGALDSPAAFGCAVRESLIACPTSAGPTTVWRVP